jgi:hypothetical protein
MTAQMILTGNKYFVKIVIIFFICLAVACKKESNSYPECVQTVIDNGSGDYYGIWEYSYNNKTVYLFTTKKCCDFLDRLYDENCNYLCAPSGGISGKGDNRCPDFMQNAQRVKLVWGG